MKYAVLAITIFSAAVNGSEAFAQDGPQLIQRQLTFTGTVVDDGMNTIKIRQPDGSLTPYAGPLPDIPMKVGDNFTISFTASLPTKEFYNYTGQISADGIYRIGLGEFALPGGTTRPTFTGIVRPADNLGQPTVLRGLTVVYDSNTETYSLDRSSNWLASLLDGPGLTYDPATGLLSKAASTCIGGSPAGCAVIGIGGFRMSGNDQGVTASNMLISSAAGQNSAAYGTYSVGFGGSWNLPWYDSNPTSVPAPGMAFAFGVGAAALMRRRRKLAKA